VGRWASEARIGVEAAPGPQTDEDLARTSLKPLLQLHGIVARIKDEQGDSFFSSEPAQQSLYLLGGDHVGVLHGMDAQYVHRSGPTLADEAEPRDELVGPSSYDGLPRRVARRMIVVAALGAALRVAAIPHAYVHSVDWRCFASSKRMASEQSPQSFSIDPPSIQSGIKATPAATMRHFEAQVNGRRNGICTEKGVGELEESIGPTVEAFVERVTEGT
jgi:hypothetical protein